jgi:ABC-type transport system involved in cytochrome c biogenesis ATPase subunit
MYSQKTFIKIAKMFGYSPIISTEKIFYLGTISGIKNILTFKERPQYQCEVSEKNTQKLLNKLK